MSERVRVSTKSDSALARRVLSKPLVFGKAFADVMVTARHTPERGWHDAVAGPMGPLSISPAAKVLHYGLEVFEGHKAYLWENGEVALFRPDQNAERLNRSASHLRMPTVPTDLQREATDILVDLVRDWVPGQLGSSLYIRPMLIASEPALGVVPATEHIYAILACPAGPYFPNGFDTISVVVDRAHPRAVAGGMGAAKTGGNYAAGMLAKALAKQEGFDEVMFVDALEHRFVEELSGMNVFAIEKGSLATPPTGGTILEGITRRSILEMASSLGLEAEERPLDVDELCKQIDDGIVTEMLAVGTAAVVTPIGRLTLGGTEHVLGDGRPGPVVRTIYDALTGIQYGRIPDERGWMCVVPRR